MARLLSTLLSLTLVASASSAFIRPCYVASWSRYRAGKASFQASNYIPGLCTHILYSFVNVSDSWTLKAMDSGDDNEYAKFKALKNTDKELKVMFSIGGGSFPVCTGS